MGVLRTPDILLAVAKVEVDVDTETEVGGFGCYDGFIFLTIFANFDYNVEIV